MCQLIVSVLFGSEMFICETVASSLPLFPSSLLSWNKWDIICLFKHSAASSLFGNRVAVIITSNPPNTLSADFMGTISSVERSSSANCWHAEISGRCLQPSTNKTKSVWLHKWLSGVNWQICLCHNMNCVNSPFNSRAFGSRCQFVHLSISLFIHLFQRII